MNKREVAYNRKGKLMSKGALQQLGISDYLLANGFEQSKDLIKPSVFINLKNKKVLNFLSLSELFKKTPNEKYSINISKAKELMDLKFSEIYFFAFVRDKYIKSYEDFRECEILVLRLNYNNFCKCIFNGDITFKDNQDWVVINFDMKKLNLFKVSTWNEGTFQRNYSNKLIKFNYDFMYLKYNDLFEKINILIKEKDFKIPDFNNIDFKENIKIEEQEKILWKIIRDQKFIRDIKKWWKNKNDGKMICQGCKEKLGDGEYYKKQINNLKENDYIEVHHINEISNLKMDTKYNVRSDEDVLNNYKFLCPNCHKNYHID